MITLYHFPISHFCEKARWALDYKKLAHRKVTLLPGLHVKKMKAMTRQSSVPVIDDADIVIAGSDNIISHLDEKYPENALTPSKLEERDAALAWESELDREIGVNMRVICYNSLLERPDQVIPFFIKDGPWYGRFLMPMVFPKMAVKMRALMNINDESTKAAIARVDAMVDKILDGVKDTGFLVGNGFTRADLAAAALLAPLAKPVGYGLEWPEEYPPELEALREKHQEIIRWVDAIYHQHR